jgi:uncharacterized membrane protein YphA (DoxX/SURF4 family)
MERSPPLAAPRRYYPGFFGALFLVLLRTAIGWHFLVEGLEKLNAPAEKPFTAEHYLRGSTGPLAPWFRSQVPDVYGLERLAVDRNGRPATIRNEWRRELDLYANHYGYSPEQRAKAETALVAIEAQADAWFADPTNAQQIAKYAADVERLDRIESAPNALRAEREKMYEDRKELESTRRDLLAPLQGWTESLRLSWSDPRDLLTAEQQQRGEPDLRGPMTTLDWINLTTSWGLTLAGAGLMLGLLTPLSALVGAALLCMFYLSMPPWPGLPEPPNVEGHYWYVNKNLVELLACLVVASTPNGLWIGLDAVLFGWIGRKCRPAGQPAASEPPGGNPAPAHGPRGQEPIKPVPVTRSER